MLKLPDNRWQAFSIHLAISAAVFCIILSVIYFVWYPGVFMHTGGWQGIKIVAAVDLVLGPALTLIIYNKAKKSIKLDLTVIGILQISCLAIGVSITESQRPVLQVLTDDKVVVHSKSDLGLLNTDMKALNKISGNFPKLVFVKLANTKEASIAIIVDSLFTKGIPIENRFELFSSLDSAQENQIAWRLEQGRQDKSKNCIWMKIQSPHFAGETCFHKQAGIIDLRAH